MCETEMCFDREFGERKEIGENPDMNKMLKLPQAETAGEICNILMNEYGRKPIYVREINILPSKIILNTEPKNTK